MEFMLKIDLIDYRLIDIVVYKLANPELNIENPH